MTSAVVFAYHQVGVRCLEVLLAQGIKIPLVFTHVDDPKEAQWFPSLAERAKEYGLRVVTPDSPNTPEWRAEIEACSPDFLFSFYYRHLISSDLLQLPTQGALNMHGSLLPRYRGRVPVNWAVIHGEQETGATLHYMTAKADQGDIVDQMSVPILPNDTAYEVFQKVCVAAECVLHRTLPALVKGAAPRHPQDSAHANYFGRRTPEDGRIVWSNTAQSVHNLIRSVSSPYPGAFFDWHGQRFVIERSLCVSYEHVPEHVKQHLTNLGMHIDRDDIWVRCGDGEFLKVLRVRSADHNEAETRLKLVALQHKFGSFLSLGEV